MLLCFHRFPVRVWPAVVLLGTLWMACAARGAPSPFKPYEHRALYLYHFATFTTWPDSAFSGPGAPLVVGVLGEDPFGKAMNRIQGEKIGRREVEIRHYRPDEEVAGCHVLFIAQSEQGRLAEVLRALEGSSILTVAEMPGFLDAGGMINLLVDPEKKLLFEINLVAVRNAGLDLNSQLLRLAQYVKTAPPQKR